MWEKLAVRLAERNGVSEEKAALAALLHDIAKELPKDRMLQIITENAIIAKDAARHLPPVWHGAAAAVLAKTEYGVEDEEILSAIRCHTTGKPHMSKLDKSAVSGRYGKLRADISRGCRPARACAERPGQNYGRGAGHVHRLAERDGQVCGRALCRPMHSFVQSFTEETPVE